MVKPVNGKILELIRDAEAGGATQLGAVPKEIFASLVALGDSGSTFANYVLGRAQIGADCGQIAPLQLVPKLNYREGYTRLLRAAHGGEAGAWFELYQACTNYRSVLANQSAALFFLEQAAQSGHPTAQTRLGIVTLLHAEGVQPMLAGQKWLCEAAGTGDAAASRVLSTFLVPDNSSHQMQDQFQRLITQTKDSDLSFALRVARAFRLTKSEAAKISAFRATRRSLVIKPSRPNSSEFALPATTDEALELLFEFRQIAPGFSAGRSFERRRAAVLQKLLDTANISEELFFAPQSLDLGPYRSVDSWRKANLALLKSLVPRQ